MLCNRLDRVVVYYEFYVLNKGEMCEKVLKHENMRRQIFYFCDYTWRNYNAKVLINKNN